MAARFALFFCLCLVSSTLASDAVFGDEKSYSSSSPSSGSSPSYGSPSSGSSPGIGSTPSSGSPGYGSTPSGSSPSSGSPGYGSTPSGSSPSSGSPGYGSTPSSGSSPSSGSPVYGSPSSGSSPVGDTPVGDTPVGDVPSGDTPVGGIPDSPSTGDAPIGGSPTGTTSGCSCDFWAAHTNQWPQILSFLTTVANVFGGMSQNIFGSGTTLGQAVSTQGTDPYHQLLRHGTASLLNSYTVRHFAYTPQAVKSHFNAALVSKQAAAVQASKFANANRGYGSINTACL